VTDEVKLRDTLSRIKETKLARKIFKVSNLEIKLLMQALDAVPDLTLTSGDAKETASAMELKTRLLLLHYGSRLDETPPHMK
jgi:hypothetical protein